MNKQELIDYCNILKESKSRFINCIDVDRIIDTIKQLDEPQKVKVPQCVAEKIEYFKKTGDWDLFQAMDYLFGKKEIREWLEDKNNQETYARAWLDGYEVEKEKRYLVKMLNGNFDGKIQILSSKKNGFFWSSNWEGYKAHHTRKELEDTGFGWVFDCPGIEIEEVE